MSPSYQDRVAEKGQTQFKLRQYMQIDKTRANSDNKCE